MVKKPRRRKGSLRAASKVQEKGLQSLAARLAEEPALALPECRGHASHFKKAQKHVAKAWAARDDEDRLAKVARSGFTHPLARAYAATLLVGQSDASKVIMLQVRTPFGVVPVASRGKARPQQLAGLQNLDDRKLRLLSVLDLVRKKGLRFYSMPDGGIVCGGRAEEPPREFLEAEAQALGLVRDPEGFGCVHAVTAAERLVLAWRPARASFRRCLACAREGNTLLSIVQHVAARDVLGGFDVRVDLAPLPQQGAEPVELPAQAPVDAAALERYKKGDLDDAGLLAAQRAARLGQLRQRQGLLLVNGGVNYGRDVEAFVASLAPSPLEAPALRAALQGWDKPLVLERGTAAKVLTELWAERGQAALEAIAGSADIARAIHAAHDVAAKGVGPALQQAQARGQRQAMDAALPAYRDLPPGPRLADAVARAHRAQGAKAALALLDAEPDPRLRPLVHALELALGAGASRAWKYAPLDLEVAKQLEPRAAALLAADAQAYHEALVALARAAGSTEELRKA